MGLLQHLILVLVSFLTLYPVLWVIKISLGSNKGLTTDLSLLPSHPTLENFRFLLVEKPFLRWLYNSTLISLATTILGVILACTAAYAYSRFRFPGRNAGLISFLVTQMFPGTLMLIPLYLILDMLHLLDKKRRSDFCLFNDSYPVLCLDAKRLL